MEERDQEQQQQQTRTNVNNEQNAFGGGDTPVGVNNVPTTETTGTSDNTQTPATEQTNQPPAATGYTLHHPALHLQADNALTQIGGNLQFLGGATPLDGQLQGQHTATGYSLQYAGNLGLQTNIAGGQAKGAALKNLSATEAGLQQLHIGAKSLQIGDKSLKLSDIQATLTGNNPQFTVQAASGSAKVLGEKVEFTNAQIMLSPDGQLREIATGVIQTEDFRADNIRWDGTQLELLSVGMPLPQLFKQRLMATFQRILINPADGSYGTASGQLGSDQSLRLMHDSLQMSAMTGTVELQNDQWMVDVTGNLQYNQLPNVQFGGQGHLTYQGNNPPAFSLVNGTVDADLGGMMLRASGVEYDDQQRHIRFANGAEARLTNPAIQGGMTTQIPTIFLDNRGFKWEPMAIPGAVNMEILPGIQATMQQAALKDRGDEGVVVDGGVQVNAQGTPQIQAQGTMVYRLQSGHFTASMNEVRLQHQAFAFLCENGVVFNENGFDIDAVSQMTISQDYTPEQLLALIPSLGQLPLAELQNLGGRTVQVSGIHYKKDQGLTIDNCYLSEDAPAPISLSIGDMGINTSIAADKDSGEIQVGKEFGLDIPPLFEVEIPIAPPLCATIKGGIEVGAEIAGSIAWEKHEDNRYTLSGGLNLNGFAGVSVELLAGIDFLIVAARMGIGARFGLDFTGYAGLETELEYNPEATNLKEQLRPIAPIKMGYFFDANLISSIYLILEASFFKTINFRKTWDLKEWTLGSLLASGASEGNDLNQILKNMHSHVALVNKKGKAHNLIGDPVELPESVRNKRKESNDKIIGEMLSIAKAEKSKK